MQLIDKQVFIEKTKPTLAWLKASFEACDAKGSAAYYSRLRHPLRGWSSAYPETTGYLIETMLDYYKILQEDWLFDYTKNGADWICTLQKENGALPVYGSFLLGTNWHFTTLVNNDYCVSRNYDLTKEDELLAIIYALKNLKELIINR